LSLADRVSPNPGYYPKASDKMSLSCPSPGGNPAVPDRVDADAPTPSIESIIPLLPVGPDPTPDATWRAWRKRAPELADHTFAELLVNDAHWTTYLYEFDYKTKQYPTNPFTGKRIVGQRTHFAEPDPERPWQRAYGRLGFAILEHNFKGCADDVEARIGLFVSTAEATCKWSGLDYDAGPDHVDGDEPGAIARAVAAAIVELRRLKLPFRVEASNRAGGVHVWYLLGRFIPLSDARRLAEYLARGWFEAGMNGPPETVPESDRLGDGECGKALRLPGPSPKDTEHFSAFLADDDVTWLHGAAAIDRWTSLRPDPSIDPTTMVPDDFEAVEERPSRPSARPAPAGDAYGFQAVVEGEEGEVALARAAVAFMGYDRFDPYHDWIGLAMMLKELDDAGFTVWNEISAECDWVDPKTGRDRYDGTDALWEKWEGLRPGGDEGTQGLGSLFAMAYAADPPWDGRVPELPALPGSRRRRPGLLSRIDATGANGVTPQMSRAWDLELDRPAQVLAGKPALRRDLATRLGLSTAGLDVVSASVRFGYKHTNEETKDGERADIGGAWMWPERDATGATVALRRLFGVGVVDPERSVGKRTGLVSRRGILSNLKAPGLKDGPVIVVHGLLDFAAVAARRMPVVGLPVAKDPRAGLADLAALLEGDARPVAVIIRKGDDPWDAARPVAGVLGRSMDDGEAVQVLVLPEGCQTPHAYYAGTPGGSTR
jgi:hypothetical protein